MPTLELYLFRFRDPLTGKWVRARYKAELHERKARDAEYEVIGPPEIRHAILWSLVRVQPGPPSL